jgi:hypothetical protein
LTVKAIADVTPARSGRVSMASRSPSRAGRWCRRVPVDWLKSNFLKTELEPGRCLRLPAEGPCECDLYLTCAKFVTTPD